jgi:hypothetical protein
LENHIVNQYNKVKGNIMAKKKLNLNEMHQAHGKDESRNSVQSLDQLWGDDGMSKYKTLDVSEYTQQLAEMNKSDLQNHAAKLGLVPIDSRDLLVKRLVAEFKKHATKYQKVRKQEIKDESVEAKVRKLLSD